MGEGNVEKDTRPSGEEIGALVLQTGRQAGARRPLGVPTTFIGRDQRCDIRLNVDGIDRLHCLLACGPGGVQIRDLDSMQGTHVNGTRIDQAIVRDGDILKVGPFQFRLELAPLAAAAAAEDRSNDETREALRVQAAAIAAQQAALEEEETRLEQRRSDLKQQEEQLAAHLGERQRQVQLWTDYTKAERETLRRDKAEQEKHFAKLDAELRQSREEVALERQQATQARARIGKIYQRLRQRWQRQWAGEREKHQRRAGELDAQRDALQQRERDLHKREAAFAQEVVRIHAELEAGQRALRQGRDALKRDQEFWRRRRSQEHLVLKVRARELDQTQIKVKQIREILGQEKDAWDKQHDALHKELYGLNNRIVHLRFRVQEQQEELARLDAALRERKSQVTEPASDGPTAETAPGDSAAQAPEDAAKPGADGRRCQDLDRLAGELADQRAHLIEQFNRLADIHAAWQEQRDGASADLEALAERLLAQEQGLAEREQQIGSAEENLQERKGEAEAVRRELESWRDQLQVRTQAFAHQHQQESLLLRRHQTLLQEHLAALAGLRQRWNACRQKEIECLQAERQALIQEQKDIDQRRLALFEKGRSVDEDKRILAEKALALEQYRQEVFLRVKDPTAQRRVERLRRRWLTLNSNLIRNAKTAGEVTKKELADLNALRDALTQASARLAQDETTLADKQTAVEERELALRFRVQQLDQEVRQQAQHHVEAIAHAVYQEPDAPAIDKAA